MHSLSKTDLQSLLGWLNHATKLAPHARIFLNRGFNYAAVGQPPSPYNSPPQVQTGPPMVYRFSSTLQREGIIHSFTEPTILLEVDACLVEGGGVWVNKSYFFYNFPPPPIIATRQLDISALECLNVLAALRVWQASLSGHTIQINCNNTATVMALATGKSACMTMTDVLRETWANCSLQDIMILPVHKPGEQMEAPDLLSRAYRSEANWEKLVVFKSSTSLQPTTVPKHCLYYPTCHWDKPTLQ